ncbi:DUF4013 domain-containing protein [Anoxynatronum sibiricum]|uniref:DUF4013 domain-containing protein n=1 Tax=Anoxynatronum sibiricum TaxID=210623 RepID=A0ABU9VSW4_9CLOT
MSPETDHHFSMSEAVSASLSIGRDPAHNQVVIQHPDMSRKHAVIQRRGADLYLTDLNSTHGTYVDGVPVKGTVRLNPPQWIQFKGGNFFFDGTRLMNQQMETVGVLAGATGAVSSLPPSSAQTPSLTAALLAPLKMKGWPRWLLGSLLTSIPVIEVFTLGYRYRLYHQGMAHQWALPRWEDWGSLFLKGLQLLLIRIVYYLMPSAVAIFFFAATYRKDISAGLLYTMLITTGLAYLLASFLMPMAVAGCVHTGTMKAAFRLPEILRNIGRAGTSYLLVFLLVFCLLPLNMLLVAIPYVGYPLGIILLFYVHMVAALLYGAVYRNMQAKNA